MFHIVTNANTPRPLRLGRRFWIVQESRIEIVELPQKKRRGVLDEARRRTVEAPRGSRPLAMR